MKKNPSPWVDYKALKQQVSILAVLQHFQIEIPPHQGSQIYRSCPLPNHAGDGDNSHAFSVNTEKNCWRCLTHCGSGNALELFALLSGKNPKDKVEFREAALQMQEIFLNGSPTIQKTPKPVKQESEKSLEPNPQLTFSLQTKPDIPYLLEEKQIPMEVLKEFSVGFCSKGMFSGRVTLPIHNRKGDLVAYAGRGLKEADIKKRGRWLFPTNFHKSLELFNQHRLDHQDVAERGLVVVEGFWSVIRWHMAGYSVVGLMGCELSDAQRQQIAYLTDRVWLMLDNDKAGTKAQQKVLQKLAESVSVRLVNYPVDDDDNDRLQPEDFTPDELATFVPV